MRKAACGRRMADVSTLEADRADERQARDPGRHERRRQADVCKTFAGDIHNPTGFEFWNGGVLVAQGPDLLFLKDTNGDDKYDVKERIIHGLDTADTHHTANSFVLVPR